MEKLKEKREISIDNKIFTKDDVICLINLFIKLSNKILDKSKEIKRKNLIEEGWKEFNITERHIDTSHSSLEFTSSDNSTYTGTFEDFFDENDILDNKKIVEIDLYFSENVLHSTFKIKIRYSDSNSSSSYAIVDGQDRTWVDETIRFVEDFLSSCKNQSRFVKKFQYLIFAFIILLLVLLLLNLIEFFIRTKVIFPKIVNNLFTKDLTLIVIVLFLITATPAVFICERLKKLFPGIEIQTGTDFQHIEKEKLKKLWVIISLIVIPTILSFLLRLL